MQGFKSCIFFKEETAIFKPKYRFDKLADITPDFLKANDISCLIIDVDNTLTTDKGKTPFVGYEQFKSSMIKEGISLVILSNGKKERLSVFAKSVGLPFVSMAAKPLPFGYFKAIKKCGAKRKNAAIVGDQVFTDILGGWISGVRTILVEPFFKEEKLSFKIRRNLEDKLKKRWEK